MLLPALTPAIKLLVPAVFVVSPSAVTVPLNVAAPVEPFIVSLIVPLFANVRLVLLAVFSMIQLSLAS
jgi:hypothetical protein